MQNSVSDFKSLFFITNLLFFSIKCIKSLFLDLTHFQSVFSISSTSLYQGILKISYAYRLLTETEAKIHHISCSFTVLQGMERYCVDTVQLSQCQSNVDLGGSGICICKSAFRQKVIGYMSE